MKVKLFLILDRYGAARLTKRPPDLTRGELCLRLSVSIPDNCFAAPTVDVELDVPEDMVRLATATVDIEQAEAG